ncbi:MAG: diacylglycerol/lipid kinase family protein [Acidobacteriota bacterium]
MTNYLIYNPVAGKLQRNPAWIGATLELLRREIGPVEPAPTTGPKMAGALARECAGRGAAAIYVAGGDGTINEVINGLAGMETPLGVLPGGTANCLAVELGIGTNLLRAAGRVKDWERRRIALGKCTPARGDARYFVAMAGAGVDAQIVREVNPGLKKKLGKAAYWTAGFAASLRILPEMRAQVGGREAKVSFALVSRVKNYGGDLEIAKTVSLDEPGFEVVMFEGRLALRYLKYLSGVLVNRHRGMSGVHVHRVKELELAPAGREPVYLQLDGELFGELPAKLEIRESALTLLAPAR